jgi:hypothetical protein
MLPLVPSGAPPPRGNHSPISSLLDALGPLKHMEEIVRTIYAGARAGGEARS